MTSKRYMKPIHAYEMLALIDSEKDEEKKLSSLKELGIKSPLNWILSLNYDETIVLDLPGGFPPLNIRDMDQATHPDLMGLLANSIQKIKYCRSTETNISSKKKQMMFYDILINCPMKDAEILCSAKDHVLIELYPSITAEFVSKVFPSYVKKKAE